MFKIVRNPRELNPNQLKNPTKQKDVLEKAKEKKVETNLRLNKKSPKERVKRNKNQHQHQSQSQNIQSQSQRRNLPRKERALKNKERNKLRKKSKRTKLEACCLINFRSKFYKYFFLLEMIQIFSLYLLFK